MAEGQLCGVQIEWEKGCSFHPPLSSPSPGSQPPCCGEAQATGEAVSLTDHEMGAGKCV